MLRFAIESTKKHRRGERTDRAGLIIFGREAAIEFPPLDENLPPISKPEKATSAKPMRPIWSQH